MTHKISNEIDASGCCQDDDDDLGDDGHGHSGDYDDEFGDDGCGCSGCDDDVNHMLLCFLHFLDEKHDIDAQANR